MLFSRIITAEPLLRPDPMGDGLMPRVAETPSALSAVPLPMLLGLGVFVLSAIVMVGLELRAEKGRARHHSAARF